MGRHDLRSSAYHLTESDYEEMIGKDKLVTNIRNIHLLHDDRPDDKTMIESAIWAAYEELSIPSSSSKSVTLERLLRIIRLGGDNDIQFFALKQLLNKEDVINYQKWFAEAWFRDMPETLKAFNDLTASSDEQDLTDFFTAFNSEGDLTFVFSIRCSFVSWNDDYMTPLKKGSPYLHFNCGTKTLKVSGATLGAEGRLVIGGTEIDTAKRHFHNCGPGMQGLSITSTKGVLLLHPYPMLDKEDWKRASEFLGYITDGVFITSDEDFDEISKDGTGIIITESGLESHNSENVGKSEDLHNISYIHPSTKSSDWNQQTVSSSQDKNQDIPCKMTQRSIGVQVMWGEPKKKNVEVDRQLSVMMTESTCDPSKGAHIETNGSGCCVATEKEEMVTILPNTALLIHSDSEQIPVCSSNLAFSRAVPPVETKLLVVPDVAKSPASTSSGVIQILKHSYKKTVLSKRRSGQSANQSNINLCISDKTPPGTTQGFSGSGSTPATPRRATRGFCRQTGELLVKGLSYYTNPLNKKKKRKTLHSQEAVASAASETIAVSSFEDCTSVIIPDSGKQVQGTESEEFDPVVAKKLLCVCEENDGMVHKAHPLSMPSLSPCVETVTQTFDYDNQGDIAGFSR